MFNWLMRLFAGRKVCSGREALQQLRTDSSLLAFTRGVIDTAISSVVSGRKVRAGVAEQQAEMAARAIVQDVLDRLSEHIERIEMASMTQKGGG